MTDATLHAIPLDVKTRDRVLFSKYSGTEMRLRGLVTCSCDRVDARERAKDIANDRGNEDQRGR